MNSSVSILLSAFILSVVALAVFIASMRRGLFERQAEGASVIFDRDEQGRADDPAAGGRALEALQAVSGRPGAGTGTDEMAARVAADRSSAPVVLVFLLSALVWLIVASAAGMTASIKLHEPDWLSAYEWLSFGRVRTLHLNALAYGWTPLAGLGLCLWLLPRLLKTRLIGARWALLGLVLWNSALIAGLGAIAVGINDGLEWLEIPWQISLLLVAGGTCVGLPLVFTLVNRRVHHLYVSVWYMGAALFWFPVLYLVAKLPHVHAGVGQATMNWWYGHNVLGLFYTPLALATIYYFVPKVLGRPVQSYNLSLLGFWSLAFFYGQVGGHHLVGGPVPQWLITLSIVQSMMMLVPMLAFAVNAALTFKGRYRALRHSPTLRFMAFGAAMYLASSVQGSFEALRSINTITHFTHYTVAHAHLGLYGFVAMVFFGGIYFVMPRVVEREWPYPRLILLHFWLAVAGLLLYFITLSIGGWLQGLAMLDGRRPFMDSVALSLPYLKGRSIGGALMSLSHLVFVGHFAALVLKLGPSRDAAALFHPGKAGEQTA